MPHHPGAQFIYFYTSVPAVCVIPSCGSHRTAGQHSPEQTSCSHTAGTSATSAEPAEAACPGADLATTSMPVAARPAQPIGCATASPSTSPPDNEFANGFPRASHSSHSWRASNRVRAPASSSVIRHEPSTWGSSRTIPPRLLTTRFVNPGVPPCVVHVAGIAHRLLPFTAGSSRYSTSKPAQVDPRARRSP